VQAKRRARDNRRSAHRNAASRSEDRRRSTRRNCRNGSYNDILRSGHVEVDLIAADARYAGSSDGDLLLSHGTECAYSVPTEACSSYSLRCGLREAAASHGFTQALARVLRPARSKGRAARLAQPADAPRA
jgi:hypothetical protein